jgi:hypothetical protein
MLEFSYYDAARAQPLDFSPVVRAGDNIFQAGRDAGGAVRDAAAMLLTAKERQRDRDFKERSDAADRAFQTTRDARQESGANYRAMMAAGTSMQNASLGVMADRERSARIERMEQARARAEIEKEENKRRSFAGAMEFVSRSAQEPDWNPVVSHKVRAVDVDPALGSVFADGGEPSLVAHFKGRGMDDMQANKAAKAALQAKTYEYTDPGRTSRLRGMLTERFGPEAAEEAMGQRFGKYKYESASELEESLRPDFAASMSAQFSGGTSKSGGMKRIDLPGLGVDMADYNNLTAGGDWQKATPGQKAQADMIAEGLAAKDQRLLAGAEFSGGQRVEVPRDEIVGEYRSKLLTMLGWGNLVPPPPGGRPTEAGDFAIDGQQMDSMEAVTHEMNTPASVRKIGDDVRKQYLDMLRSGRPDAVQRAREILMGKPEPERPPSKPGFGNMFPDLNK